uniref:Uncharacterized protein n=1 Tax=Rhizophora mucronata TaxID=61149 RepID=A0A2P2NNW0_RHIMU
MHTLQFYYSCKSSLVTKVLVLTRFPVSILLHEVCDALKGEESPYTSSLESRIATQSGHLPLIWGFI